MERKGFTFLMEECEYLQLHCFRLPIDFLWLSRVCREEGRILGASVRMHACTQKSGYPPRKFPKNLFYTGIIKSNFIQAGNFMKKLIFSIILIFTLTSCSLNDMVALLVTPTPIPVDTSKPAATESPNETPTITPTQPTPTFTVTPTLIGDTAPPVSDADVPTLTPLPTLTQAPRTSFLGSPGSLIMSMSVSSPVLYWGYCEGIHYVDFDVRLASNIRVAYVLLFLRLVDKGGNQSTGWGGGAIMEEVSGTTYTYRITPEKISHYEEFKDAWIEYQIIAASGSLESLDRTPVYKTSLSLEWCRPAEYQLTP